MLLPFWIIEGLITSSVHFYGNFETTNFIIISIISIVLLSVMIGIRFSIYPNVNIILVAVGAASLSFVTLVISFISYTITSTELIIFLGAAISMLFMSIFQAIIGSISYLIMKKIKKPELLK